MMRGAIFVTLAAACLLVGFMSGVQADWTICNKTPQDLLIAVAYVDPRGGFISEGWYRVRGCGGCLAKVVSSGSTSDPHHVFYYAESLDGGEVITGESPMCVSADRFTMDGKGRCQRRANFRLENIDISKNWTTTITGGVPGRSCID